MDGYLTSSPPSLDKLHTGSIPPEDIVLQSYSIQTSLSENGTLNYEAVGRRV